MKRGSIIYKEKSRERLKKIINKKFMTTIIFPLSEFEQGFGYLWGHQKPFKLLTEEEKQYRKIWEDVRENILRNGKKQRENSLKEIDMNEINWLRYNTYFKPVANDVKEHTNENI